MNSFLKKVKDKVFEHFEPEEFQRRKKKTHDQAQNEGHHNREYADSVTNLRVGPTTEDRPRDDDWDCIFDVLGGWDTDNSTSKRDKSRGINLGMEGWTLELHRGNGVKSNPRSSEDHVARKAPPRRSETLRAASKERTRDRDTSRPRKKEQSRVSPQTEGYHHHRSRHSSKHQSSPNHVKVPGRELKEDSARIQRARVSNEYDDSERAERMDRERRDADREEIDRKVEQRKQAESRARREEAAMQAYQQARSLHKRPVIVVSEQRKTHTTPVAVPHQRNPPLLLTADNLRAAGGNFVESGVPSTLNRPLGDMTRTFIEGMVPAEEVEGAEMRERVEGLERRRHR